MTLTLVSERVGRRYTECVTTTGVDLANIASRNAHPANYAEALALRLATGITTPPLGPDDLARAYKRRYGWDAPSFAGTELQLIAAIRAGSFGAVHIIYGRLPEALRIQKDFLGGHCILAGPTDLKGVKFGGHVWIADPLFYPGSGYSGAWWPEATLIAALNAVVHGPVRAPVPLATLLRPGQFATPPNPHVRVAFGMFVTYTVRQDVAAPQAYRAIGDTRRFARPGTIIPVAPIESPVLVGGKPVAMRAVTGGQYQGSWVVAHGGLPFSD